MLEIKNLTKSFNGRAVVNNVDLLIGDGEFLSILGPSGCGKTTLLRLVAGHEFADQGTLTLAGQNITSIPPHQRDVHTVFQRYALFPHMNIFDNVAFGLRCSKVGETEIAKRVENMLELANLKGQGKCPVTSLSGGEQQRVALVRALINLPKLLLLDEPLGALDLKLRLQLQHELIAIQKRVKTTFVFVTHDQQEALNMSDRVAVMNKGQIEQLGTPHEIYEFPKTLFTADFVGGINKISGKVSKTADQKSLFEVENVGHFFTETQVEGPATLCIRPEKLSIFQRKPTSLENILEATVKSQTYLGTHTQYEVTLKNNQVLTVFKQNSEKLGKKSISLNDKVFLGWTSNLSHVFRGDLA